MSLETLCERIIADAQSEAARIEEIARDEAARIGRDAKKQALMLIDSAADSARIEGESLKKQRLAGAKLAARDRVVGAKQDLIDETFSAAGALLDETSEADYVDYVVELIGKVAAGGEVALFDRDDLLAERAVKAANSYLESRGSKPVSLGRLSRPLGKGFILQSEEIEENFSFDSLVNEARERLENEVAEMIFSES